MKRVVFAVFCLAVLTIFWGCSGSGSGAPSGAVVTLTPSDTITVESSNSSVQAARQSFLVTVKDSKAENAPGVRDVTFTISFTFANPPSQQILADAASAVTLCDGTRIAGTLAPAITDSRGNYNLCILYKAGGGLAYSGTLIVSSGDQSPSVGLEVTSKPQELNVSPKDPEGVPAGSVAEFTIVGGIPPYSVSANPSFPLTPVPSVVTSSGGTFDVTVPLGTQEKTSTVYTVTDALGSQVTTTLTIGLPSSVPQVLPETSNVLPGGTSQFMIVNGFPGAGYTIFSDNALVLPSPSVVASSGGTFSVTVPLTIQTPSTVKFTIRDSAGSTATATLNVTEPPKPVLSPSFINTVAGGSASFSITGGIAPYTVTTTDASMFAVPSTVLNSGGTFRVSVPLTASTGSVTVTVTDALGVQASATMNITGKVTQPLEVNPSTWVVTGASGDTSAFVVTGGTAPYTVVSTSAAVYFGTPGTVSTGVSASGGTFTATVAPGTSAAAVNLIVTDAAGGKVSVAVTIQ